MLSTLVFKQVENLNNKNFFNFFFFNKKNIYKFYYNYFFYNKFFLNTFIKNFSEVNLNCKNLFDEYNKNIIINSKNKTEFKIKNFDSIFFLWFISFFFKSIKNVCIFIKDTLEEIYFKDHTLCYNFFFFICNELWLNKKMLRLGGIHIYFKGKLNRGGNARKKKIIFKKGLYSNTNKLLKLNYEKFSIRTDTGSQHCFFKIFFLNK